MKIEKCDSSKMFAQSIEEKVIFKPKMWDVTTLMPSFGCLMELNFPVRGFEGGL